MNRRDLLVRSGAAAAVGLGLFHFPLGWTDEGPKRKLLFFTKSSGFEHSSIKRKSPDDAAKAAAPEKGK